MKMNLTSTSNSISPEKRFGFWGNLPLPRKLLLAFGVLFVFAVIVAIVTLWGLNRVTTTYEEVLTSDIEVRRLSDQLEINLLQARRNEKDFRLRWQVQGYDTAYANYATLFYQHTAAMRESLNQLAPFGEDVATVSTGDVTQAQYEADLASFAQNTDSFENSFTALIAALKTRGSDENTGLEGAMRTAAHNIEAKVSGVAGLEQLEITYLSMRRHEKDYVSRNDQTYIDQVHTTVAQLKTEISGTDQLDTATKTDLRAQADAYLKTFDEIVVVDQEIAAHVQELDDASHAIEPLSVKLTALGAQLAADDTTAARANGTQTFTSSIVTVLIVLVISIILAVVLSRQITRPVVQLTDVAQQISSGNFDAQAEVTSADEVGTLAHTFNTMTSRLRQAFEDVRRRASELATVATISTQTATILDPFRMLESAVHLTQRGFGLYHAHVFTYHKDTDELKIIVCGYKEGDEHEGTHGTAHIPVTQEQSLVARAARTRKAVIVNDVRSDPGWLPNPLLPDTRAELAVPMIVGEELLGVLDVQSERVDAFTDADANIQTTLASQLATALKNSQSFTESKAQADLESMVNAIGQKIQRTTSVDDTLQTAIREIGLALGASRVSANISGRQDGGNNASQN
jgi:GAF domain-containing protein